MSSRLVRAVLRRRASAKLYPEFALSLRGPTRFAIATNGSEVDNREFSGAINADSQDRKAQLIRETDEVALCPPPRARASSLRPARTATWWPPNPRFVHLAKFRNAPRGAQLQCVEFELLGLSCNAPMDQVSHLQKGTEGSEKMPYKQETDSRLAALNKLRYSVWTSRGAALALSLDACLLVLPMCRECLKFLWPKIRWIPFHNSQWFHYQVAYSLLFYTIIHTAAHYVNFFNVSNLKLRPSDAVQIHYTQPGGITGHIMLLCMLLIYTTAHAKLRRQSYEGFWYMHHLFIIFYLALLCHGTGCFVRDTKNPYSPFAGKVFWKHCIGYQSFRWELVPLTIYFAERIYRFYRSRKSAKVVAVFRHNPKLLEIRFEKEGMHYKAGQWVFVKFPDIMVNQWHPFSLSSCPEDPFISVHIQQLGDFTGNFADVFDTKESHYQLTRIESTDIQELRLREGEVFPRIRIDGPYGSLGADVFKHEVSVIVGAGIGITPWSSILKSIWHLRNDAEASAKSRLKRLEFIWVCKDILHYKWLHEHITALEEQSQDLSSEHRLPILRSRIFITRQLDPLCLEEVHFHVVGRSNSVDPEKKKEPSAVSSAPLISSMSSGTISGGQFQARMLQGRPDFVHELGALTQELVDEGYVKNDGGKIKRFAVGVYYCGPDGPGKSLRDACVQVSGKTVKYQFWKERG